MKDKSALRPEFYTNFRKVWEERKLKEAEKEGVEIEDQSLHTLAQMDGWTVLKKHIDILKQSLDLKMAEGISKGQTREQVGDTAIMVVLGKELLDSIIHKVEDAVEVVEEIKNEGRETSSQTSTG
jgi:hypothetical protein